MILVIALTFLFGILIGGLAIYSLMRFRIRRLREACTFLFVTVRNQQSQIDSLLEKAGAKDTAGTKATFN